MRALASGFGGQAHHARTRGGVGHAIDKNQRAGSVTLAVAIHHHALFAFKLNASNFIQAQCVRGLRAQRVHIHQPTHSTHSARRLLGTDAQHQLLPAHQRLLLHPHQVAFHTLRHRWIAPDAHNHIAATAIHFVFKGEHHTLRCIRKRSIAAVLWRARNPPDARLLTRRQNANAVSWLHASRSNLPCKPAEIEVRAQYKLHRHTKVCIRAGAINRHRFKKFKHRATAVPRSVLAALHHVVTIQRTDRHRHRIRNTNARTEVNKLTFDGAESLLAPSNNVHLVDRRHHMANTKQAGNERMPARLCGHAFARINQADGQLAMTCASCHVARVLLMAGAVGNDETTTRGSEVSPRNINRDSLFALRLQAVDCKC